MPSFIPISLFVFKLLRKTGGGVKRSPPVNGGLTGHPTCAICGYLAPRLCSCFLPYIPLTYVLPCSLPCAPALYPCPVALPCGIALWHCPVGLHCSLAMCP